MSLENIYAYGCETFSETSSSLFIDERFSQINNLSKTYLHHPECRYLKTEARHYRNLRYGGYLVIYKVQPERIEVLNIIHATRSITAIRATRKIKIK